MKKNRLDESLMWRTLGVGMNSGVPLLMALNIIRDMFPAYQEEIQGVHDAVKEGDTISMPLVQYEGSFHPLVSGLVDVGEETGSLPTALVYCADLIEREFDIRLKGITTGYVCEDLDKILFFDYNATMVDVGVPLLRCLRVVHLAVDQPYKDVSKSLADSIEMGSTFSEAMKENKKVFTPFDIYMVRSGEAGGVLDITLRRLVDHLTKEYQIRAECEGLKRDVMGYIERQYQATRKQEGLRELLGD